MARHAEVTASAETPEGHAEHVINGLARDLPNRADNRWVAPMRSEGVWLQLTWKQPVALRQVQITFDTGFHRVLTLTHQDSFNARMIRSAQPETARDYELIVAGATGRQTSLARISGNCQRLKRHIFEPVDAKTLRLQITATNGSEVANVFEIRCYS
jgi:hypothetical protein